MAQINTDRNHYGVAVTLGVIAALYSIFAYLVPYQVDNLWMEQAWRDMCLTDYLACRADTDNFRLCNILTPIFTVYLPKWAVAIIAGTAVAVTVWLCTRLICRTAAHARPSLQLYAASWLACVVFLPWRDRLFICNYSINYIFGAVLTLSLLSTAISGRHSRICLILAFVVGWWHEGFAVTLCAGIAMLWLVRRRLSRRMVAVLVLTSVITVVTVATPGTIARISHTPGISRSAIQYLQGAADNILTIALLAAMAIKSVRRAIFAHDITVILAGSAVCGLGISFLIQYEGRTAYWPQICSLICWGSLFARKISGLSRTSGAVFAVVCVALCSGHMILSIVWQYRLWRQHTAVMTQLIASPRNQAFYDLIRLSDIPAATLYMPVWDSFTNEFQMYAFRHSTFRLGPEVSVVPEALDRDLHSLPGRRLDGNAGVIEIDDALYIPGDQGKSRGERVNLHYVDSSGRRGTDAFYITPFHDSRGDAYLCLIPRTFGRRTYRSLSY